MSMTKEEYLKTRKNIIAALNEEYMKGKPRKFNEGDVICGSHNFDHTFTIDRVCITVNDDGSYHIAYWGPRPKDGSGLGGMISESRALAGT